MLLPQKTTTLIEDREVSQWAVRSVLKNVKWWLAFLKHPLQFCELFKFVCVTTATCIWTLKFSTVMLCEGVCAKSQQQSLKYPTQRKQGKLQQSNNQRPVSKKLATVERKNSPLTWRNTKRLELRGQRRDKRCKAYHGCEAQELTDRVGTYLELLLLLVQAPGWSDLSCYKKKHAHTPHTVCLCYHMPNRVHVPAPLSNSHQLISSLFLNFQFTRFQPDKNDLLRTSSSLCNVILSINSCHQ